jgi:hypothetical protein
MRLRQGLLTVIKDRGVALLGALTAGHRQVDAALESFVAGWRVAMWTGTAVMTSLLVFVSALSLLDKLRLPLKGSK